MKRFEIYLMQYKRYLFCLLLCIIIAYVTISSCVGNNSSSERPISYKLCEAVDNVKKTLPQKIETGLFIKDIDYRDSFLVYTFLYNEKEGITPFEKIVHFKNDKKELLSALITYQSVNGARMIYEECVSYGISLKYVFVEERTHKELCYNITPAEISDALNAGAKSDYELLALWFEKDKKLYPISIDEGIKLTDCVLQDSMAVYKITLDEKNYKWDIKSLVVSEIKDTYRKELLRNINSYWMELLIRTHCGIKYNIIGSISSKTYCTVVFSPEELYMMKY